MTFATVSRVWREVAVLARGAARRQVVLDLSAVERTDSAGVALLVALVREMRVAGAGLALVSVPEQALAIARLSGVETLLLSPSGDEGTT